MGTQDTRKAGIFRHIDWKPIGFVELFIFLILAILLAPLLHKAPLLSALLAILFLNILIVCLSFVGFDVRYRWPLILLWLLGPVLEWAAPQAGDHSATMLLYISSDILRAVLLLICVVLILCYVLKSHEVTLDTIFGALIAYFLIALIFSCIYQAIAVFEPANFSIPEGTVAGQSIPLKARLNYFSFITIATVGYGDIVPRLPASQTLAILEAVIGQFYMAGLIAWLVSAYARQGRGNRRKAEPEAHKNETASNNNSHNAAHKHVPDKTIPP